MSKLILVRHGTSEYNNIGKWTGVTDVNLAPQGYEDARLMAEMIKDIDIDKVHLSELKRTHQTLDEMKKIIDLEDVEIFSDTALNERDYGVYTGKNKWQIKEEIGNEAFQTIRRGWDVEIESGENLEAVYRRMVPYFGDAVLPQLKNGNNVMIVSHGNTLRALIKHLENISDKEAPFLEFDFGEVHCYDFDKNGNVTNKEIRASKKIQRKH